MKPLLTTLLLFVCVVAFAQENPVNGDAPLPASLRNGDIRAEWTDRAAFDSAGKRPAGRNVLWYKQSAHVWEEALPIGNGRLGGMVLGGVADGQIGRASGRERGC